jgi:hypothetical protein
MSKIASSIDRYLETRLAYERAKSLSDEADRFHKGAKAALVEAMLEEQQTGVKLDNGLAFNLSNQFSFACNENNEEDVKVWLHERYGDLSEFTVEKLHKPSVSERLKADIEGEQLDEFDVPEFFDLKTRPNVNCQGWKDYVANHK